MPIPNATVATTIYSASATRDQEGGVRCVRSASPPPWRDTHDAAPPAAATLAPASSPSPPMHACPPAPRPGSTAGARSRARPAPGQHDMAARSALAPAAPAVARGRSGWARSVHRLKAGMRACLPACGDVLGPPLPFRRRAPARITRPVSQPNPPLQPTAATLSASLRVSTYTMPLSPRG